MTPAAAETRPFDRLADEAYREIWDAITDDDGLPRDAVFAAICGVVERAFPVDGGVQQ